MQPTMRNLLLRALVIPFALTACGGGGDDAETDANPQAIDGSAQGIDAMPGGALTVPATITMTAGFGGPISAGICQNLLIGGGISYSLQAAPQCPGGEVYLTWLKNPTGDTYAVIAGTILTENNDGAAVAIQTTSVGTVTKAGADDTVADLTAGSDITIETASHSPVTFSFSGDDVTISAFTAR